MAGTVGEIRVDNDRPGLNSQRETLLCSAPLNVGYFPHAPLRAESGPDGLALTYHRSLFSPAAMLRIWPIGKAQGPTTVHLREAAATANSTFSFRLHPCRWP